MVLWLRTQVLEDRLLPVSFHVIPVLNLPMADGIIHAVAWGLRIRECFIADEEVEVLDPTLGREVSGSRWYGRS